MKTGRVDVATLYACERLFLPAKVRMAQLRVIWQLLLVSSHPHIPPHSQSPGRGWAELGSRHHSGGLLIRDKQVHDMDVIFSEIAVVSPSSAPGIAAE